MVKKNQLFERIKDKTKKNNSTLLIEAIKLKNEPEFKNESELDILIETLMTQDSGNINSSDSRGFTALMLAIQYGHKEIVYSLIKHGVNCTLEGNGSQTDALPYAIHFNQLEIASCLIQEKKVDIANRIHYNSILTALSKVATEDQKKYYKVFT